MLRFFSKFVVICNIAFLISVILRFIERDYPKGSNDRIIKFEPVENSIIILGYSAVIFNLIFLLIILGFIIASKYYNVKKQSVIFCLIIFIFQLIYFFF